MNNKEEPDILQALKAYDSQGHPVGDGLLNSSILSERCVKQARRFT